MKFFAGNTNQIVNYSKVYEWGKLLLVNGAAQLFIQILGIISGILIIRILPTEEYAYYTIATTMLSMLTVLSDSGISSGVMAEAGSVWKDRIKLGTVIATGIHLRKKLAIIALIIILPVLFIMLRNQNASWSMSFILVVSIVPGFLTQSSTSLLEIPFKLHQKLGPLQQNKIIVNFGRLLLITSITVLFPWAFLAILAAAIPQYFGNWKLRNISLKIADWRQDIDKNIRTRIIVLIKRILPPGIYFIFSGQITIFLISIFGNTSSIAQVGALSRLSMLLSFVTILFSTLIIPRFAKLPKINKTLFNKSIQILTGLVVMSMAIIYITWLFSPYILWVIGDAYQDLNSELILYLIGSCLTLISGASYSMTSSRGWAVNPIFSVGVSLLSIIIGILLVNITSLEGILKFNILVACFSVIRTLSFLFYKIGNL